MKSSSDELVGSQKLVPHPALSICLSVAQGMVTPVPCVTPGRYEFIAATRSVTALKAMFGKPRRTVSIKDMNAVIARRGAAAK